MYYPRGYEMLTNGNQTTVWRPMKSRELDVSSKAIVASLIIEHTVNFALSGNIHGPCNYCYLYYFKREVSVTGATSAYLPYNFVSNIRFLECNRKLNSSNEKYLGVQSEDNFHYLFKL